MNNFAKKGKVEKISSYKSQGLHKEKSPRIRGFLDNNNPPVALQININNNLINVPQDTSPKNFSFIRRMKPKVMIDSQVFPKRGRSNRDCSLEITTHRAESTKKKELDNTFMTSKDILHKYSNQLTNYEKGEILDYDRIYYFHLIHTSSESEPVFSDRKGFYNIFLKDHIAYRYEILKYIGKGSFGQALKCFDHKEKRIVAVKLLRDKKKLYHQGIVEAKILKYIKDKDVENKSSIIHMIDCFIFRRHIVITFELLSINLYALIANNNFKGLSIGLIKRFGIQLLTALAFLKKHRIIHCDLKPENILLVQPNKSAIKLIDFGSSCFANEQIYTYIQSRFYRAPEIMLGMSYTTAIDMWSLGCILCELFTGAPLFPGNDESEQMGMILELNGLPSKKVLMQASRREVFFQDDGTPIPALTKQRVAGSKQLVDVLKTSDEDFLSFIRDCLIWDPEKRLTPEEALLHPWIVSIPANSIPRKTPRRIPILDETSNAKEESKRSPFKKGSVDTSSEDNAPVANGQYISEFLKLSDKIKLESSIQTNKIELPPIQEGIKVIQNKKAFN